MHDGLSHLTPAAAILLTESDERRIRAIRSRRWILYPRAKQALDRLGTLLDQPRGTRMALDRHLRRQRAWARL
jgi:hypothetical protein